MASIPTDQPAWVANLVQQVATPIQASVQRVETSMTALQTQVKKVQDDVNEVKQNMAEQGARMDSVEAEVNKWKASESNKPERFVPRHIEIRAFCDFTEKRDKGINRDQAEARLTKLISGVPQSLQAKVGELELYG